VYNEYASNRKQGDSHLPQHACRRTDGVECRCHILEVYESEECYQLLCTHTPQSDCTQLDPVRSVSPTSMQPSSLLEIPIVSLLRAFNPSSLAPSQRLLVHPHQVVQLLMLLLLVMQLFSFSNPQTSPGPACQSQLYSHQISWSSRFQ
jgi:hypothetical protein